MFLNVQGAAIHFTDTGTGTPTLFLHGIPDSGEVWKGITELVSATCRCVVPDLPGFGKSSVPTGFEVTLDSMADFINDFVIALGMTEPINLVVHDIGGPYGLAWALRYPAKIKRIVIMNTVFQSEYRWHRYGRICRIPLLGELMQGLTSQAGLARELRASSGTSKPTRAHIEATYRAFASPARRMVLRLYRGLAPQRFAQWDSDLRSLAAKLPSLVLWGDRDPYIPNIFAERFGARQVLHFPDCGHWLQVEIPDVVSRELVEFFSR
jgi:pimeloyl-ACP methyl ester carboxylesterase